jgi:two-component system chemotaxis sensor kinase CheA
MPSELIPEIALPASDPLATDSELFSNPLARDPEMIADFLMESREHLCSIEAELLALEQDPLNSEALNAIFRGFHTIKGLAGFLEFSAIQAVAHEIETLLDLARNATIVVTASLIDIVLESSDYLKAWIKHIESRHSGRVEPPPVPNTALQQRIRMAAHKAEAEPDSVISQARLLGAAIEDAKFENPPENSLLTQWNSVTHDAATSVKVSTAKLDYLFEMAGEMVIAQSMIRQDPDLVAVKSPRLLSNISQAARITGEVQKTVIAMRMLAIGQVFQRMTRLVRDLARKSGKQVELEIHGEEVEVDRTIVEQLADPLMHMVRNAADHGVEDPQARMVAGKPPIARISLRASHQGGNILIEVSDDGRGLDREKIRARAIERGLIDETASLSDSEMLQLIFAPGFSTAETVTELSGRGVGMDVVKRQIQKMRGRIEIESVYGTGTTFRLRLPLTLAIIDGLVVGVGKERYVVPVFAVQELLRPTQDMVSILPNGAEMASVRERLIPVTRLNRRFGVTARSEDPLQSLLIICESQDKRFGVIVDELIGKQEVVIKNLGEAFSNVTGIAGGAILGDGRVGLILDMEGIYRDRTNAHLR